MGSIASATPAFGAADLSNCERESIHLAGSIQPFGALLLLQEPDLTIVQCSANAAPFLRLPGPLLGKPLASVPGNLIDRMRPHLDEPLLEGAIALRCWIGDPTFVVDALLHRPVGGGLVIELERSAPRGDLAGSVHRGLSAIVATATLEALSDETAVLLRRVSGYDRVMVYRFDAEGHGQVFAEQKRADLEPFLGNWYPASDIPQIARRLYERNRVRVLADVGYDPVPLLPRQSPISGQDLDMSLCLLRSMSPLHIQYLTNMGVAATLVMSLMVGGRLWGLVACHHYSPRVVPYEMRSVCELLAEAVATRIAALEGFMQAQAELAVRRLETSMVDAIAREGNWRAALFDRAQSLLGMLRAEGAALLLDDEVQTTGDVPATQAIREIGSWLKARAPTPVVSTTDLARELPHLANLLPDVGGFLAVPISRLRSDYLLWFRPERIKTVTWGGNPTKPFVVGNDPRDLSPRRSFAQWHELVEGTCETWTDTDRATAHMVGEMVADVMLQFQAVSMLIVQDQLEKIGRQVHASEQPVLIADARGRILMKNEAFGRLLCGSPEPLSLSDLVPLFESTASVDQSLKDLVRRKRAWRGEALLKREGRPAVPLLLRGDPVMVAQNQVLGFVLLFLDISERRAAEDARSRFLDGILTPHHFPAARMAAASDPLFQGLMSTVIENAQMAALEITDGIDLARVPPMLDAIRASVDRTGSVLERLIWYTSRNAGNDA